VNINISVAYGVPPCSLVCTTLSFSLISKQYVCKELRYAQQDLMTSQSNTTKCSVNVFEQVCFPVAHSTFKIFCINLCDDAKQRNSASEMALLFVYPPSLTGAWGGVVVKALRYYSEGPGIDPRLLGIFSRASDSSMCLGVDSASKKSEYQDIPGVKDGRCVRVTTLPPSCAECLEILEP
jgi:hypothetical protein